MKLPRWLVIAMLTSSVLSVLAAAGWWWVTWPERTAREFVDLVARQKLDEASKLIRPSERKRIDFQTIGSLNTWKQARLRNRSRTLLEILGGSQQFKFGRFDLHFAVERGKVILIGPGIEEVVMWVEGTIVIHVDTRGVRYGSIAFPKGGRDRVLDSLLELDVRYSE